MKPLIILILLWFYSIRGEINHTRIINSLLPNIADTLSFDDFSFHGYHIQDSLSPESYNKLKKEANAVKYDTGANYYDSEVGLYFKKSILWFYYKTTRIASFELHDNSFVFIVKGIHLKIGDDVAPVKQLFPNAYKQKYQSGNISDTLINVYIGDYEGLLFNVSANKIKGIEYWVDNS